MGLEKQLPITVVGRSLGVIPPNGWPNLGVDHPFIFQLYFFSIFWESAPQTTCLRGFGSCSHMTGRISFQLMRNNNLINQCGAAQQVSEELGGYK
jgi:hypothetical protein